MTELSTLVCAAQLGDHNAFGQIVSRFQDMAYASAYAIVGNPTVAEDVAQESFLDAYQNLTKLRDPAAFPGWFRRLVFGHSHRQIRQQMSRGQVRVIPLEDVGTLYTQEPDPATQIEQMQLTSDIHRAIQALPESQRQTTVLYYVEGYSQKEIAAYLDVSLSAIKKRLFDARKKLQKRMIHMVQKDLQKNKPSQDREFANKVQFFTALLDHNLAQLQEIVAKDVGLLKVQAEWKMALKSHYWPTGATALHIATAYGNREMVGYLLTQPVEVDILNPSQMTPLHVSVLMNQMEVAVMLLEQGANINALTAVGQSALHHAALRENVDFVELLLKNGAELSIADQSGRTPMDWAVLKRNKALVDLLTAYGDAYPSDSGAILEQRDMPASNLQFMGKLFDSSGNAVDGSLSLADLPEPNVESVGPPSSPLLNTGIKIIDLFAPLQRGGCNGICTAHSGVGFAVVTGQMAYSMYKLHHGCTVSLSVETSGIDFASTLMAWREYGVEDRMSFVYVKESETTEERFQMAQVGIRISEHLRQNGQDVLLLVDGQLAQTPGVLPYLREQAATSGGSLTLLVHGHFTVGAEPEALSDLDSVITFDFNRAQQRLYPAVDPAHSKASLLNNDTLDQAHQTIVLRAKRLLTRYAELHIPVERGGLETLWYIDDDPNLMQDITRARRLTRFLTQPFYGTEPWVGVLGQHVSLEETLRGCQEILDGKHDALPEEAFKFVGTIDEAVTKAAS